jgi:hypothetical protein
MERLFSLHMYSVKFQSRTEFIGEIVDKILDDLPVTEAINSETISKTQSLIDDYYDKNVKKSVPNEKGENQLKTKSNSVQTTLKGFVFAKKNHKHSLWSFSKDAAVFELMDSSDDALLCKAAEVGEENLEKDETKADGIHEEWMDSQEDIILLQAAEAREEDCEDNDKIDWDSFFEDHDFGDDAETMGSLPMDVSLVKEENNVWTDSEIESVDMELYAAACEAEALQDS